MPPGYPSELIIITFSIKKIIAFFLPKAYIGLFGVCLYETNLNNLKK